MSARKMAHAARARRRDLVAIVCGTAAFILAAAWVVADPESAGGTNPVPYQLGFAARLAAAIALMTGISGLHRVHAAWAGTIGTVAFAITAASLVGFAVVFSAFWVLGWLGFHAGAFTFGLAVLRGRVLSKLGGWILTVGVPTAFAVGVGTDRIVLDGEGSWITFAGTAVALIGFMTLAVGEARRSARNARRLAER